MATQAGRWPSECDARVIPSTLLKRNHSCSNTLSFAVLPNSLREQHLARFILLRGFDRMRRGSPIFDQGIAVMHQPSTQPLANDGRPGRGVRVAVAVAVVSPFVGLPMRNMSQPLSTETPG